MVKDKIIKYFYQNNNIISPWHDLHYKDNNNYNFICEIPKLTKKKIELCKHLEFNPFVHDIKNNEYRYYHQPIYWNYGFIPQTWENPENKIENYGGDNDPLDFIDISSVKLEIGGIYNVKILGSICLLDDNEIDWKIIGINKSDIESKKYNDIQDLPNYIKNGIREWFRWYKYSDGILNSYLYNEEYFGKEYTIKIIEEYHLQWKNNKEKLKSIKLI